MPPVPSKKADYTPPKFLVGDCCKLIPELGQFSMIFCDPPFNIGQAYVEYEDDKPRADYKAWTSWWMRQCYKALKPGGIIALHGPDNLAEEYLRINAELTVQFGLERIAWINWHYRFGQCGRSNWIDSRCHCLVYTKTGEEYTLKDVPYTWNPEAVLVDSDRVAYGDKRVAETERGGKRLPMTMWGCEIDDNDDELWDGQTGIETMRSIPNVPNHWATMDGQILGIRHGKLKQLGQNLHNNYFRVWLVDANGEFYRKNVHVLVCETFHGPRPNGLQVLHRNGVHTDNRVGNLRWGTLLENMQDRDAHGKTHSGEIHHWAKLTDIQAEAVRELATSGQMTYKEIGELFGIGQSQVARIKYNESRVRSSVFGTLSDKKNMGRVQGNNGERRPGHPNQLPIRYVERLIRAYTNKGDRVLDPFSGSGTTSAVCQELGRHCVTIDISEQSIASAKERCTSPACRAVTRERLGL